MVRAWLGSYLGNGIQFELPPCSSYLSHPTPKYKITFLDLAVSPSVISECFYPWDKLGKGRMDSNHSIWVHCIQRTRFMIIWCTWKSQKSKFNSINFLFHPDKRLQTQSLWKHLIVSSNIFHRSALGHPWFTFQNNLYSNPIYF